jgi:hypothetical protein
MVHRWGFEEQFYPVIFKICCALANYNISAGEGGSLRVQEGDEYGVMLTRICTKGKKALEDVRERMKRRRSKRAPVREAQERIDREAAIHPEEDEQRMFAAYSETSGEKQTRSSTKPPTYLAHLRESDLHGILKHAGGD